MVKDNRPLTHDEKKAAEAAFRGAPCDPKWSDAAYKVYFGLSVAMANQRNEVTQEDCSSQTTKIPLDAEFKSMQMSRVI